MNTVFSNNHWILENYKQRVTRKEAQAILLVYDTIIFRGDIWVIKCKHIGAGIYEIFKAKK
jgi:hypothetical protein